MNRRNQLQWVALLTAAVVIPTVSLLWFMSRVVANERLVIRQKLAGIYGQKLKDLDEQVKRRINSRFDAFSQNNWTLDPYGLLRQLVLEEGFQGVVIWGPDGKLIYPSIGVPPDSDELSDDKAFSDAWRLEFVEFDYASAADLYRQMADSADPRVLAGLVRCLVQLGAWEDACEAALKPAGAEAAPSRLLLLDRIRSLEQTPENRARISQLVNALAHDLFQTGSDPLPPDQNLFIGRKLLEFLSESDLIERQEMIGRLSLLVAAEDRSIDAARLLSRPAGPIDTIVPMRLNGSEAYVCRHPVPFFGEMNIILTDKGLASTLDGYRVGLEDSEVQYRILNREGRLIAGDAGEGTPAIASAPLPRGYPEGRVELFFADGDMFRKAAGRQVAVYVWTGLLVIVLMLAVGAFAVQEVGRQMRLNRLKNDFIATVSHELKTPLASMRLLVDTLLEGRTRDEAHAREYLQMIARENERLTRMIENFLSFSRMERNRNAFSFEPAVPAAMVEDAVESVCTKYRTNGCNLDLEVPDDLPEVEADHDAMVTVLINLLDNACKYTAEDKRIRLRAYTEGDEVCFAVSDNGVGLSRRQIRHIFESFYQADSSLSRTTEGCGLGLSIVRFIINTHKGRIEVDSEPGEGSTFTVRLPLRRRNGTQKHHGNGADS